MKCAVLSALIAALPIVAAAEGPGMTEEVILCHDDADKVIRIELWHPSQFDTPLHCIHADRLAGDPVCAPNGGWGLFSDGEAPALVAVTMDWKTAHEHPADKVTAIAGPKTVRFNAQHGIGTGSNQRYEWKFTMDRRSGDATWFDKTGERLSYRCDMQS